MTATRYFLSIALACSFVIPAGATTIFDSGPATNQLGAASRPPGVGQIEIEAADDFLLNSQTMITGGTFTGLLPAGLSLGSVSQVTIEIYRVFPLDSANPPSGRVPTRTNSPSDVAFDDRDSAAGGAMGLSFNGTQLSPAFVVS